MGETGSAEYPSQSGGDQNQPKKEHEEIASLDLAGLHRVEAHVRPSDQAGSASL
jgi:hypothetical protein